MTLGGVESGRQDQEMPAGFEEHEVTIPSGELDLSGTLTLPRLASPCPAALILPGSGPLDRDAMHWRMPLGISRDLASALAGHGVAALRYDKRGVGDSPGSWLAAGFSDNVADAGAALAWLRARPDVQRDAVFVVGHSEGCYLVAALGGHPSTARLGGVVLLAAPARPGDELLIDQTRRVVATLPRLVRRLLALLPVDVVERRARRIAKLRATHGDVVRVGLRRVNARWYREVLDFDPRPGLARLDCSILAITGSKDLQVDPADLSVIAATAPGPVQTVRVPNLTHTLRRDPTSPTLTAYRRLLRRPTDPQVLGLVASWIASSGRRAV